MNFSGSNYEMLKHFIAIHEHGNISRAAESLGMTPSGLNHSYKNLEKQLDIKLFMTSPRGVKPTSEGIELYEKIKPLFLSFEFALKDLTGEFNENSSGIIRVSAPPTIFTIDAREYFKNFCKTYKKVKFKFYKRKSEEQLLRQEIDIMIDSAHAFNEHNFTIKELWSESLILIASKEFLAKEKLNTIITIEQLQKLPFICHEEFFDEFSRQTKINLKPLIITQNTNPVYEYVKDGLGIGLYFSKTFKEHNNSNLVVLKVENVASPTTKTVCAYNKEFLSKAAKVFLDGLVESFKK